jgi:hypothetical protein
VPDVAENIVVNVPAVKVIPLEKVKFPKIDKGLLAKVPVKPVKFKFLKTCVPEPVVIISEPAEILKFMACVSIDEADVVIVLVPVEPEYVAFTVGVPV